MRSSRQSLAGLLALAALGVTSAGSALTFQGSSPTQTISGGPSDLQNLPRDVTGARAVQNAAMRRRFESLPQFKGPTRVRPRSTGSHKQNRRRALAGR